MIAGSGSVLALETVGVSNTDVERDISATVGDDSDASLGLTESGVEDHGLLFEGRPRQPPVTFDVVNQLSEPVSLSLETDAFHIDADNERLEPGERRAGVTVDLARADDSKATALRTAETVYGTIEIEAEGETTMIDAQRELAIERPEMVEAVTLDVSERGEQRDGAGGSDGGETASEFEHGWQLQSVDTGGRELERLVFDYTDIETAEPLDFTDGGDLTVDVTMQNEGRTASVAVDSSTVVVVELDDPIELDEEDVDVTLAGTGKPGSLGGGRNGPSGATVVFVTDIASTPVEAEPPGP